IQEMIVAQKVDILGIGITPTALAVASLATEAKKATLVLSSGASITTTKSPYFVRAGFILAPQSWILAEWAAKNGSKRVVTLVNDWAAGVEAETAFTTRFKQVGGEIAESIRIPLATRTSLRSFSGSAISSPIPPSFISRARRRRFSLSSLPNAAW